MLDRNEENESEYTIQASEDIRKYLKEKLNEDIVELKIPNNMYIWATMNSADQGVFPMDTAFKRRWDFEYIGINQNEDEIKDKKFTLGVGADVHEVAWNDLRKAINSELLTYKVNEDKLMGPYFISKKIIESGDNEAFIKTFKNKVLMYLFDDACKQKRTDLFSGCGKDNLIYSEVCEKFETIGVKIFTQDIINKLIKMPSGD